MGAAPVTMLLAKRNDAWFLAAFAPHIRGCNLSTNQKPRHSANRFHLWQGRIWVQSESPLDSITFYPEVRYWGMVVHPEQWHPESGEPLLHCRLMGNEIHRMTDPPERVEAAAVAGRSESDRQRWLQLVEEAKARARELRTRLVDDGWLDQAGEGLVKYVRVDDLEKIEGPPPKGAF